MLQITDPRAIAGIRTAALASPLSVSPPKGAYLTENTFSVVAEGRKGEFWLTQAQNWELTIEFRRDDNAIATAKIFLSSLEEDACIGLMNNAMEGIRKNPKNTTAGDLMKSLAGIPVTPLGKLHSMPRGWKIRWANARSTIEAPENFVAWEGAASTTIVDYLCHHSKRREWCIQTAWGDVVLAQEPAPGTGRYILDYLGLPVPFGKPEL